MHARCVRLCTQASRCPGLPALRTTAPIDRQPATRVGAIEPCREHICTPDCYNASGRHRQPELLSERSGMEIQKALFYRREYGRMKFFVEDAAEGPEGALLRLTRDEVGEEAELVTVSAKVYRDRGAVDFVGFLRKAVATDPEGLAEERLERLDGPSCRHSSRPFRRDRWHTLQ